MDQQERQQERLREAVDRKNEQARAASEEASLESPSRPQNPVDPRTKSTGHGKKTADKWNQ